MSEYIQQTVKAISLTITDKELSSIKPSSDLFTIMRVEKIKKDTLFFLLSFSKNSTEDYQVDSYHAILKLPIDLPNMNFGSVSVSKLEKLLQEIDWNDKCFEKSGNFLSAEFKKKKFHLFEAVNSVFEMEKMEYPANVISIALQVKYWFNTAFGKTVCGEFRLLSHAGLFYPIQVFSHLSRFPTIFEAHAFMKLELKIKGFRQPSF
ncbi:hypothetical protein HGH92_26660 [Chitinophaga varians]|uniref:Uncharacterized protein n=1 Tax=Chitinophaga varians TaxID=2202339 RepID=A0A847S399_9BACT|nr:hypothetical protein [Chitinophaga varians]NLR67915.1 hypothetical protein [Chitinophaga varians]